MAEKYLGSEGIRHFLEKIKNGFVPKDGSKVLSDNNFTDEMKQKLTGVEEGANNYTLPTASDDVKGGVKIGKGLTMDGETLNADGLTSVSWQDVSGKPEFKDVATSGSWNDILDKPLGQANGVATLDDGGRVPASQLPSYVDDVIEGWYSNEEFYQEEEHSNKITAERGKIYIDLHTDNEYRYTGSQYRRVNEVNLSPITNAEIDELFTS